MEVLLEKIYGLQKTNEEIISRVESVQEVVTYTYWMQYESNGAFKLNEIVEKKKGCVGLSQFARRRPFSCPCVVL